MRITNTHPTASLTQSLAAAGFIPHWCIDSPMSMPFVEIVQAAYAGGWHSFTQGTLDTATGKYSYPGDPVQEPFLMIHRAEANEVVCCYPHAFFAVISAPNGVLAPDLPWDMARLD